MAAIATFDSLRSIGFGALSGAYAAVGSATTDRIRGVTITNDTDASILVTTDSSEDQLFVKSQSYILWDVQSNVNKKDDAFVLPIGTQFYVKTLTAATSGSVYIAGLI